MNSEFRFGVNNTGFGMPCFIIAEAGVNHNGDIEKAHKMIDLVAKSGANAIKFQSFFTEEIVTSKAKKARYQEQSTGESGSQYEMLKQLELSPSQQQELKNHCDDEKLIFLSTPYDRKSVDLLVKLGVYAFKIASTDTTNIPFLRYIGEKGKPVLLSTGMSNLCEVEYAIEALKLHGLKDIVILHCTSEYPAPIEEVNLRAIITLQKAFQLPVGFSDHTQGISLAPLAMALGACVIEKHFTLDRKLPGPDHASSIIPEELYRLVKEIRNAEVAMGDGLKRPYPSELANKKFMQKSIVVQRPIKIGEILTEENLTCKRPGLGISPLLWDKVIGRKALKFIETDEPVTFECIDWSGT